MVIFSSCQDECALKIKMIYMKMKFYFLGEKIICGQLTYDACSGKETNKFILLPKVSITAPCLVPSRMPGLSFLSFDQLGS